MDTENQPDDEQAQSQGDESAEEFKQEMEDDPSRAQSDDDEGTERLRGG
jgi:hypothetical protein